MQLIFSKFVKNKTRCRVVWLHRDTLDLARHAPTMLNIQRIAQVSVHKSWRRLQVVSQHGPPFFYDTSIPRDLVNLAVVLQRASIHASMP